MTKGVSYQGFLPIRKEATHQSEMISQALFGESFTIIESEGPWRRIEVDPGGSEGWVPGEGFHAAEGAEWASEGRKTDEMMVIYPSVTVLDTLHVRPLLLPAGSVWQGSGSIMITQDKHRFEMVSSEGWIVPGKDNDLEKIGNLLLSIPALHGGRCGFGFDAPGLVQMLCRSSGKAVPHSIIAQAELGITTNFIHEAQKGDLAFFHNGEEEFTHVGMVLDDGRIIHASDQVRIDKLDQQGIYCAEKEKYTHQLRVVKSLR
ncbi:MAG: C40 family peptidase [Bacteroidetes bacterium]|nr:C40 family peptidase [Bacteroidota bacterium]